MSLQSKAMQRICPTKLLGTQVVMLGFKSKVKIIHHPKWEHLYWWKWNKQLRLISVRLLTELSSQFLHISMILKDKQQKMLVELPVLMLKELLMSLQLLLWPMVCKKNNSKQLLFMIWEEEHLIFLF